MATRGLSLHGDDPRSDSHGHLTRVTLHVLRRDEVSGLENGSCRDATSLHELLPEWAKADYA
ncbi:hypothetical protein N7519_007661 [Penicillium mononematosum]|uniref:uncharacterized protein n=1 Tax=Penicillium mononematosum TaxID=268346 RepID=UPI002547B92A|nr:uncharacterized protein N7519_007661 [Penicillium mononematosum]KAJ6186360.1 hypothetical protein N7519_007661 [Penicillium mononematosum]